MAAANSYSSYYSKTVQNPNTMFSGIIFSLMIDQKKQYGFIKPDDQHIYSNNLFFLPKDLVNKKFHELQVGQKVWFLTDENPDPKHRDKKIAIRIQLSMPSHSYMAQTQALATATATATASASAFASNSFHALSQNLHLHSHSHSHSHSHHLPILYEASAATTAAASAFSSSQIERIDNGPHRIVGDVWVCYTTHPGDEGPNLEFKEINPERGDVRSWIYQLMPRILNSCINRRIGHGYDPKCETLFGVRDDGRILGFRCTRVQRDEIARDLDRMILEQISQIGQAGALKLGDVTLKFDRIVQRNLATNQYEIMQDVYMMRLIVRSCVDRCPVYAYADQFGNELAYERMNTSTRKLNIGDIVARTQMWKLQQQELQAQPGQAYQDEEEHKEQ